MKIIGLCGYARVGKDTAAQNMPGWTRAAFADALKRDLDSWLRWNYGISAHTQVPEEKTIIRPFLVAHGAGKRIQDSWYWVKRLFSTIQHDQVVITDVRYPNEVEEILGLGGKVVRIHRPDVLAANNDELESITEIDLRWTLPSAVNDSTPEELGRLVMVAANL